MAHDVGALKKDDLARVAVDTTVRPKNVTHPTVAKLMPTAIRQLGKQHGVVLRQSYVRVAKRAALMAGCYVHAKQFKRAGRELRFLPTRLGRLIRDIRLKTADDEVLRVTFAIPLSRAEQIRRQCPQQRGWKLYSWHAPETECIGKGKARAPYNFGVRVSITTTNRRDKGGQFVLHTKALPGNPYDGHTLAGVIEETQALTGREIGSTLTRAAQQGAKLGGHDAPRPLSVFISGQKRGVQGQIKRELRRRSAIEAAIGHMKTDGYLGRHLLKGCAAGSEARTAIRPMPCSPPWATPSVSSSTG